MCISMCMSVLYLWVGRQFTIFVSRICSSINFKHITNAPWWMFAVSSMIVSPCLGCLEMVERSMPSTQTEGQYWLKEAFVNVIWNVNSQSRFTAWLTLTMCLIKAGLKGHIVVNCMTAALCRDDSDWHSEYFITFSCVRIWLMDGSDASPNSVEMSLQCCQCNIGWLLLNLEEPWRRNPQCINGRLQKSDSVSY